MLRWDQSEFLLKGLYLGLLVQIAWLEPSWGDLGWIYGGGVLVLAMLALLWRRLLSVTVHEDLAREEGVPVERLRLAFVLMLAIVLAAAMKIVGILLITSLLIIPAATARRFARTPEQMAVLAAVIGAVAVGSGLWASMRFDTPSGPSVVVAAALLEARHQHLPGIAADLPQIRIGRRHHPPAREIGQCCRDGIDVETERGGDVGLTRRTSHQVEICMHAAGVCLQAPARPQLAEEIDELPHRGRQGAGAHGRRPASRLTTTIGSPG